MIIDDLLNEIDDKQSYVLMGLDPRIRQVPEFIKTEAVEKYGNNLKAVAESFIKFNKLLIDSVSDLIPAVKPQMAFYELYGSEGVRAFEQTVNYAKSKGLIVIADAKRNDIGSTAEAYAKGFLGRVELIDDSETKSFDVDLLTVNAYLGIDGVKPFIDECKKHGKGIFILDKTSNKSSGDLQDRILDTGETIYELMAKFIDAWGGDSKLIGERGYSAIGPVVGATYPEQAVKLRALMSNSFFLVPGYGAQGGGGKDVVPCFNKDGYGAIVNSSRGLIFAYSRKEYRDKFTPEQFDQASRLAVSDMSADINNALKEAGVLVW